MSQSLCSVYVLFIVITGSYFVVCGGRTMTRRRRVFQTQFPLSGASPLEGRRGQVLIFSYLLIHGSYSNLSDRARRMLLIQV